MDRREHIRAAFSAAASGYETAAQVQDLAAAHLLSLVQHLPVPLFSPPMGLEIGCGTGLLTRRVLHHLPAQWRITDLSPTMLDVACASCGPALYSLLDGERDALPDPAYDWIVSNLAFQWFDDLPGAVHRLQAALRPGGWLVFSTMGQHSFGAWRQAHQKIGLSCGLPDYPAAAELLPLLPSGSRIEERMVPLSFAQAGEFARGLKLLGATVPQVGHRPLTAGQMRRVLGQTERPFHTAYHLLFVTVPAPQGPLPGSHAAGDPP